jgi:serine/threonine-protein kinase
MIGKQILTYRIEGFIGKGGMGSVYLASNLHIAEKVAIKVLNSEFAENPAIRERFKDEAKSLLALNHQNIVKFINFYENEEGQLFIIMEYVDGITLEGFLNDKNGLLVEQRAYPIFEQILDAIGYAHKQGIVHRDIKPANIILSNDNEGNIVAKILDFGIAKILSEDNEQEKGWVVGTPSYMSPEQVQGEEVDKRSDIYSLGVLLHQMLIGRAPYDSTTLSEHEINKKVVNDPLPRMKEYYSAVSDKAQKVVDKATEKETDKRYQNCNDFSKAWKKAVIGDDGKYPAWFKYAAAAIIVLLFGGGCWFWDYNRLKVDYYKDYVEVWGVPKGIGKADYKHMEQSYKFEYKQGKLQHLSLVNSKGNVVEDGESEHFDRPINADFEYQNKDILRVFYKDRNGKVLFKKRYDKQDGKINKFVFEYNDPNNTEKLLPNTLTGYVRLEDETAERGQISRFALTFDENGFVSSLHYTNRNGTPVGDKENIYGKRYERDKKGRIIKESYLAINDSVTSTSWGLGIKKFRYDGDNNLVEAVYLSPDGSPSYDDSDGTSIYTMDYDEWGNITRALYKSSDGKLMITKKQGIAGIKQTFNAKGEKTEMFNLGTDEKPVYNFEGWAGMRREYDENGYVKQYIFVDETGKSVNNDVFGGTIVKFENDPKGNTLTEQHFDANDQLYETPHGYAKLVAKYDSITGNQNEVFYYNKKNALTIEDINGIAGVKFEYNNRNKRIKETYYGTNNQPAENINGVIVVRYGYDGSGNFLDTVKYCQADGKSLKLSKEGIAGQKLEYKDGYQVKQEFFDEKENIITSAKYGYAKYTTIYENGRIKEESYFDKKDNPVAVVLPFPLFGFRYRCARIEYKYDSRGNCTEAYPYNTNRDLAEITDMQEHNVQYVEHREYDDYNNIKERTYYNANGNKTLSNDGYFQLKSVYNDKHQEIDVRAYGMNGQLVMSSMGYAILKASYDDKKGYITKYSAFNTSEKLLYYWIPEYDMHGKVTENSYYTPDNQLRQDNYAIERYKYDKLGRLEEYAMFNYLDKKADFNGCHKFTLSYDEEGNLQYQKYYSTSDNLLQTNKFNSKTGKWTQVVDWRQYWRSSIPNCPFPVDYGINVISIVLTGNGCNITLHYTGVSKHQLDASELEANKNVGRQVAQTEKRNSQMPSNTQLTVIGIDNVKREFYRVTY